MREKKFSIYIVLVMAALLSCSLSLGQESPDQLQPDADQGIIRIQVPLVSPLIQQVLAGALGRNFTLPSRAFIIANRVEFSLRAADSSVVAEWIYFPENETSAETSVIAGEGTGYTLEASVFNTVNSPDTPVVTGTSAAFDVTAGSTAMVTVTCIPVSPTAATEGETYPFSTLPTSYAGSSLEAPGGECWYSLTPSGDTTILLAQPDEGNYAMLLVYDSLGHTVGYALSSGFMTSEPGTPAELRLPLAAGLTYYAGILPLTMDNAPAGMVDFSYTPGPADADEENDTFATASALAPGISSGGLNLDADYFIITVDDLQGLDIAVDIDILNDPIYNIWFYLYDAAEELIATDIIATTSHLLFETTLSSAGNYYLELLPAMAPVGAEYSIIWNYQ